MLNVDRGQRKEVLLISDKRSKGNYCPLHPYQDTPEPIGYGHTISAPHTHALALEYLSTALTVTFDRGI
jgi:hypothetical protein